MQSLTHSLLHAAVATLLVVGTTASAKTDAAAAAAPAASAASAAASAKAQEKSAAQAKAELVCTTERVTGSRFTRRLCHTREELDAMKRAGTETVTKIQEMPIPLNAEEGRGR